MKSSEEEIRQGQRFAFGANWSRFLEGLSDDRIRMAERSLSQSLEVEDLNGKSFLDIGSGSGLFSLAARRLGARVRSFDYDAQSVACTAELKRRHFPGDPEWVVEQGSVLDRHYLERLGTFDIVYSWGVLHHTGAMWQALENVAPLIVESGKLYVAIYNYQRVMSRIWLEVKHAYNRLPRGLRWLVLGPALMWLWGLERSMIYSGAVLSTLGGTTPSTACAGCPHGWTWWTGWAVIPSKSLGPRRSSTSTAPGDSC